MSTLAVIAVLSVLAVLSVVLFAIWLMDRDDSGDPFAQSSLTPDPAAVMDMTMPPEIAHDEFPAFLTAPLQASPAALPAPTSPVGANYTGSGPPMPGTAAAAAGCANQSAPPPPLPGPAYAAANGLPHDFAEWLSDTFVGDVIAIKNGGA